MVSGFRHYIPAWRPGLKIAKLRTLPGSRLLTLDPGPSHCSTIRKSTLYRTLPGPPYKARSKTSDYSNTNTCDAVGGLALGCFLVEERLCPMKSNWQAKFLQFTHLNRSERADNMTPAGIVRQPRPTTAQTHQHVPPYCGRWNSVGRCPGFDGLSPSCEPIGSAIRV